MFDCLFALPTPKQRYLPKCKSQASRSAAYDLLVELVKGNVDNYTILHQKVMQQHHKGISDYGDWENNGIHSCVHALGCDHVSSGDFPGTQTVMACLSDSASVI